MIGGDAPLTLRTIDQKAPIYLEREITDPERITDLHEETPMIILITLIMTTTNLLKTTADGEITISQKAISLGEHLSQRSLLSKGQY